MIKLTYIFTLLYIFSFTLSPAYSQDYSQHYSSQVIQKDATRLIRAVSKIYAIGIQPYLKDSERSALNNVSFKYPKPRQGDYLLNFYALPDKNNPEIYMPILSLKALEDLTTAFAWLHVNRYSLSVIDIYYMMLRYRKWSTFPGGKPQPILKALGIPDDALKDPQVDKLSLKIRNEAFAFIIAHELGHIVFDHKGYHEITKEQARQDEIDSDLFALKILNRVNSTPFGGLIFFQAQIYNMKHRAEFKSDTEWENYMSRKATHPLSEKRMKGLINYMEKQYVHVSPQQKVMWFFITSRFKKIISFTQDKDLFYCLKNISMNAPLSILKPRKEQILSLSVARQYCK